MKNKFKFLTRESIKKKIGTKSFKIVNIVLCIIIIGIINLDSIVKLFGGDFNEPINIYVVDEVEVYDRFKSVMDSSYLDMLNNYNATVKKADKTLEELKSEIIEEESDDIIIYIKKIDEVTYENVFDVDFISFEYVDTLLYANIVNAINVVKEERALTMANISQELLSEINASVNINRIMLSDDVRDNEEFMQLIGGIITLVFIVPIFILVNLLVQMIGAEINEEKTSKSMEIIISSVTPEVHFMSKLISANIFAITQGALLILYSFIGGIIRTITNGINNSGLNQIIGTTEGGISKINNYIEMFMQSEIANKLLVGIPFFIIIILLSFLAYSLLIGVLASITTSMEDYQQIQTPVMIFLMLGYFLAIYASVFQGASFIKFMAFIPFISGILSPVMYTLGEITIVGLLVSIVLLIITCMLLYKYGLKVYKVGILNYSSSNLWKKIFEALKN